MLRRLLNIASIVCLVLCVALMGMWVRSYSAVDSTDRTHRGTKRASLQLKARATFHSSVHDDATRNTAMVI